MPFNPVVEQNDTLEFEPNPKWIMSVRDLKQIRTPGRYLVTTSYRDPFEAILKDRKRQVVDSLILNELFCASTVRIGDIVFRLKGDSDIHAETKTLSNGRKYYTLNNQVKYLGPVAAEGKGGAN